MSWTIGNGGPSTSGVALLPIDPGGQNDIERVRALCRSLAGDDPWMRLRIDAERLERSLFQKSADCHPHLIARDGEPVGILTLKMPWLFGVYVELIGVLEAHRGAGVGAATLARIEALARANDLANVWLCVSAFNTTAQDFYRRHGFSAVGELKGLILPDEDELLMRKQL